MTRAAGTETHAFFLPGTAGKLFAIYYPPHESKDDRGDVLFVPPFAGEMNYARHIISALSRELAGDGVGVLVVDLFGCGDSEGDFSEARWDIWTEDLASAVDWLVHSGRKRISLWGLRLGCLLAMEFTQQSRMRYEQIVLWQPVLRGEQMMTQFLRLAGSEDRVEGENITIEGLRETMSRGQAIQVAGYTLVPELASAIDRRDLARLGRGSGTPVRWLDIAPRAGRPISRTTLRVIEDWRHSGVSVTVEQVVAMPFWLFPNGFNHRSLTAIVRETFNTRGNQG